MIHMTIEEPEKKQIDDKVQIGDEVFFAEDRHDTRLRFVVLCLYEYNHEPFVTITNGKSVLNDVPVSSLRKTGTCFPQIAEVFAQMKREAEE